MGPACTERAASSKRCVLCQVAGGHTFPAGQLYKMEHHLQNCKTMLQRITVCFPLTESSSLFQRPMEGREGCLFPALSSASGRSLSRSQPSRSQPSLRHRPMLGCEGFDQVASWVCIEETYMALSIPWSFLLPACLPELFQVEFCRIHHDTGQ